MNSIRLALKFGLVPLFALVTSTPALALLAQTREDLRAVEDRLRLEASDDRRSIESITPILIATPQAHWKESVADFGPSVMEVLSRVFPESGQLIPCAECLQNRVWVSSDNRTVVQNGELSLTDLARLRERPGFAQAKSLLLVKETPSGIEVRLVSLDDGRILYQGLADATRSLTDAVPPLRLTRELERRQRGEALTYFHFDLGLYPDGLVQMKWLEQWGSRNQHLSGLAIGAFNPTGALGLTYLYMLPWQRKMTVGLTGYYGLSGVFSAGSTDLAENFLGQASFNLALSGSYGVFVSVDTKGVISAGFSLQNPVFLPFLF